jgi:flagellar basal body rod protein FlgG
MDDLLAQCECGSSWFRLTGESDGPDMTRNGAISFDEMGRVAAWSGTPVCIECGSPIKLGSRSTLAPVVPIRA